MLTCFYAIYFIRCVFLLTRKYDADLSDGLNSFHCRKRIRKTKEMCCSLNVAMLNIILINSIIKNSNVPIEAWTDCMHNHTKPIYSSLKKLYS